MQFSYLFEHEAIFFIFDYSKICTEKIYMTQLPQVNSEAIKKGHNPYFKS